MSRLRYLNPLRIRAAAREIKRVSSGGGPSKLRLVSVGHPEGWVLPTSEIVLEVTAKDGTISRWAPAFPVAWPYAWAWRIARRLGIPLVRSVKPEDVGFAVKLPGR